MKIKLSILNSIITNMLSELQKRGIEELDLTNGDYYWHLNPIEQFIIENDPELTVGSLSDDIDETLKCYNEGFSWVGPVEIERINSIMQYLALTIEQSGVSDDGC